MQGNNNVIESNFIGTDPSGTKGQGNGSYGVVINGPSKSNLVGTNGDGKNDAAERNLLSGNGQSGMLITGTGANQNVVAGNFIGTDVTGTVSIGNGRDGVGIAFGAQSNLIGTNGNSVDDAGERNIIAGSTFAGVAISTPGPASTSWRATSSAPMSLGQARCQMAAAWPLPTVRNPASLALTARTKTWPASATSFRGI